MNATSEKLVEVAKKGTLIPFHGFISNESSNIKPIIDLFPKWDIQSADNSWCAAFVYYCCIKAGFVFPYSPKECVTCSLAGCGGWEEFAIANPNIEYYRNEDDFIPKPGDIVLYDRVFENKEHDHIGIILSVDETSMEVAEGNALGTNTAMVVKRVFDEHIRAYIRIPNSYVY